MPNFTFKSLCLAVCFVLLSTHVFAHSIETNRTVLQKNDHATVTVTFNPPLSGDLYVATVIDGKLMFVIEKGTQLTTEPTPFQSGDFEGTIKLLDVVALNIAPGVYPLYEVVVNKGESPLNFNNWIGGLAGLKQLHFKIGLPVSATNDKNGDGFPDDDSDHDGLSDSKGSSNCSDSVNGRKKKGNKINHDISDDNDQNLNDDHGTDTPVTTDDTNCGSSSSTNTTPSQTTTNPPQTVTPVVPTTSTPSVSDTSTGQKLYVDLGCAAGGCHKTDPAQNRNKILKGTSVAAIRQAIRNNPADMGDLNSSTDAELEAIANFLSTF